MTQSRVFFSCVIFRICSHKGWELTPKLFSDREDEQEHTDLLEALIQLTACHGKGTVYIL